jgi:hypothetical protein
MKRRWLLWLGCFPFVVCFALLGLQLLPPVPGVTLGNYERIQVGMTQQEVETILGRPADRDADARAVVNNALWREEFKALAWRSGEAAEVWVLFHENGTVYEKCTIGMDPPQTFLDQWRRRLLSR